MMMMVMMRPERADFMPERVDFSSERADFRPERSWVGGSALQNSMGRAGRSLGTVSWIPEVGARYGQGHYRGSV